MMIVVVVVVVLSWQTTADPSREERLVATRARGSFSRCARERSMILLFASRSCTRSTRSRPLRTVPLCHTFPFYLVFSLFRFLADDFYSRRAAVASYLETLTTPVGTEHAETSQVPPSSSARAVQRLVTPDRGCLRHRAHFTCERGQRDTGVDHAGHKSVHVSCPSAQGRALDHRDGTG